MATNSEMLAAAEAAYRNALASRSAEMPTPAGQRRVEHHDIDALLKQVKYWRNVVAQETRVAAGGSSVGHSVASFER